jgi:oligopeptide transport system substrate-binding protein
MASATASTKQTTGIRHWAGMACVLLLLLVTGCGPHEQRADLVIMNGAEPESLDPAIVTGQPDGRVCGALFEGLTRFNPKNAKPIPGLAERWDISEDGKTYTFYLRPNLVWSTGEPITSEDVVYSWRRALDPLTASDYAGQLYYVKNGENFNTGKTNAATGKAYTKEDVGVAVVDRNTVKVDLEGPTPFFLDLCAFRTLAIVPRQSIEKHGDRWLVEKPLPTSGPYTLDFWRIHDRIRVRKNPLYWDAKNIQSEVIDLLPTESANTALNLYMTGEADVIWDKNLVPSELMDVLKGRPYVHTYDYLGTYFIRFNLNRKPFDDVRVRKALTMVLDKKRIVERITRSGEKIATCLTPPGMEGYTSPEGIGYDPVQGRKLLAEAGFPGGKGFPTFSYLFNTSEMHKQVAVELQEMWQKELGITMEIRQTEWKVYLSSQSQLDYDLSRSSWIGDYVDPNTFLDMFMSNNGNNRTGWKNSSYDDLIRAANQERDTAKRAKLLHDAEVLLVREDVPIAPLFFYIGVNIFDPAKVEGVHQNLLDEHPLWPLRKLDGRSTSRKPETKVAEVK